MFDREIIYHWIYEKKWSELLNFVSENPEAASSDEVIQTGIRTFVQQLMVEITDGSDSPDFSWYLEMVFMLHKVGKLQVSDEDQKAVVVELVKRKQENLKEAYDLAQFYPTEEVCVTAIKRYLDSIPKVVRHSQTDKIHVTENNHISNVDYTIALFKSQQEYDFYLAVVQRFPNHAVYPNVALSCLVDLKQIEHQLMPEEKRFFYSGIVDCVVFDIVKMYKPIRFFELDSIYHDSPEQAAKDKYKDRILSLAGQKLYRIRKVSKQVNQAEFFKLVHEVLQDET